MARRLRDADDLQPLHNAAHRENVAAAETVEMADIALVGFKERASLARKVREVERKAEWLKFLLPKRQKELNSIVDGCESIIERLNIFGCPTESEAI